VERATFVLQFRSRHPSFGKLQLQVLELLGISQSVYTLAKSTLK
jgi:hypothetical protein